MATLKISSNSVSNPLTLDLSQFLDVQRDSGLDPQDPQFSQRVWGRSILREGATLALEQNTEKELVYPLYLGPIGGLATAPVNQPSLKQLEQQINQIINTPGFTVSWQPSGASQPTIFDGLSGQLDIDYDFRREDRFWEHAKLRLFTQPFGRTAGPRLYATASGVGPLLMISPFGSGGQLAVAASTQAGVAGYGTGSAPGGVPSGGVFYWGNPSMAGDAPALLQVSYVGPLPNTASNTGTVPYMMVSVLPDQYYQPLYTAPAFKNVNTPIVQAGAVASQYISLGASSGGGNPFGPCLFSPTLGASPGIEPTLAWGGSHRILAIARASQAAGCLLLQSNALVSVNSMGATVYPGVDWQLYDVGAISLRPSEYPKAQVNVLMVNGPGLAASATAIDVTAFIMLPEKATWFLNPTAIQASQYGYPLPLTGDFTPYTNTLLIDDTLGDQFIYAGASQTFAPSPLGSVPSSARITQYSRGLVPRPDPRDGLPIIAIVGVGQTSVPSTQIFNVGGFRVFPVPGASWSNPQNRQTMAQVNVWERTRYVLP